MASAKPERSSQIHRRTSRFKREQRALGGRVRGLRHDAGWTLEGAAERCELDWKHLQKIEAGALNVTLVTLVRLAVGFRRPLHAFFAPTEDPSRAAERSK
ncbi:MAG: helix-turn-helix domain-containing protein [Polyangiaceae bacterium]